MNDLGCQECSELVLERGARDMEVSIKEQSVLFYESSSTSTELHGKLGTLNVVERCTIRGVSLMASIALSEP